METIFKILATIIIATFLIVAAVFATLISLILMPFYLLAKAFDDKHNYYHEL